MPERGGRPFGGRHEAREGLGARQDVGAHPFDGVEALCAPAVDVEPHLRAPAGGEEPRHEGAYMVGVEVAHGRRSRGPRRSVEVLRHEDLR